ncbi:uncharacterized protein LOC120106725 [Phoenix dactylifera]|uniref:Uncharacterized protein LOC120106725 n=1 Tax=Phoenix dactylifera TaxID=42345 RepID=A0A8B8ZN95_PHODC|nr:uncharacterized protein LOC120106725 [Phoenix dactylifera]
MVDRLSDLPDPLVATIVGKLPFKEGARMNLLGKRYRRIWPCSLNIVLDEADFTLDSKVLYLRLNARNSLANGIKRTGRVAFVNHVRRFIARCQEPKINTSASTSLTLRKYLMFNCRCLEELKLASSSFVGDIRILEYKNRLLTHLTIKNCYCCMEVMVEAPKLKRFEYSGALKEFELGELANLEEVELNFGVEWVFLPDGDVICNEILRRVASARTLAVCSFTLQVIDTGTNPLHLEEPIDRLEHLKMKKIAMHRHELRGIAFLLRSCSELENLTIEMGNLHVLEYADYADEKFLEELEFWESVRVQPFQCLQSHLKGEKNEVSFLQFLLEKSAVLQEMSRDVSKATSLVNIERYIKAAQGLRSLYKASPFVQIVIS